MEVYFKDRGKERKYGQKKSNNFNLYCNICIFSRRGFFGIQFWYKNTGITGKSKVGARKDKAGNDKKSK